jgi:predicted ester cyclase
LSQDAALGAGRQLLAWLACPIHPALQEFTGIPASGQTIRVEGMNFYRLKDGRVTDIWTQFDGVAMMQQLGAIPA